MSDNQEVNISGEAIEAALEAFWANEDEPYITAMKAALEAAAPHLMAEEVLTTVAECVSHYHQPREPATVHGVYVNGQPVAYCGVCAEIGESYGLFTPTTKEQGTGDRENDDQ